MRDRVRLAGLGVVATSLWLAVSITLHGGLLALALSLDDVGGGDGAGLEGAGGDTVEILVMGAASEGPPMPELVAPEAPPPGAETEAPTPIPQIVPSEPRPPRNEEVIAIPAEDAEPAEEPEEVVDAPTTDTTPSGAPQPGPAEDAARIAAEWITQGRLGQGDARDSSGQDGLFDRNGSEGLGPGSIAGQRALLPGAARCDDPVVGVWRAHKYKPIHRDWAKFTLRIRRVDGNRLTGTITSHLWSGSRFDSSPPPCGPGVMNYVVSMRANGRVNGNRIEFGASSYRIQRAECPVPFFGYNPDHFSGTIDPARQEFQSVNNDGGRDINAPYVFRRTSCDP